MAIKIEKLNEQLFVVSADFNIWSGQKKMLADDIRIGAGGRLPPEKVAQLGNKKIVDPDSLKPFHRLKVEARRFLESYGMPFLGGYALPNSALQMVEEKLDAISVEYEREKGRFLANYDSSVQSWIQQNPEFASEIRRGVMQLEDVEKRIQFGWEIFRISPAEGGQHSERMERKLRGLGDDLIAEVGKEGRKFLETCFGKEQVATSTAATLRAIRTKVEGLAFLNGNLQSLVDLIDECLKGYNLHKEGRFIVKPFLYQVLAVGMILSDEDKIQDWADGNIHLGQYAETIRGNDHLALDKLEQLVPYDVESEDEEGEQSPESEPQVAAEPVEVPSNLFDDLDDIPLDAAPKVDPQIEVPELPDDNWAW